MKNLRDYFSTTLLLSGTPDNFQKNIEKEKGTFRAECPLYIAVDEKWVCRPRLNLVFSDSSDDFIGGTNSDKALPGAIKSILENEIELTKKDKFPFPLHLLVCCKSIDSIGKVKESLKSKGLQTHFISLHSEKDILEKKDGSKKTLKPEIDDQVVTKKEVMKALDNLQEYFKDELPVVVFQVNMISEGVNIKSFNSIFIQTHSDRLAMQQIGRVLRDSNIGTHHKKDEGHASVYCMVDTIGEVADLMERLEQFGLNSDAFDWGRKIDLHIGGSTGNREEIPEEAPWKEIDEILRTSFQREFKSKKSYMKNFIENMSFTQKALLIKICKTFLGKKVSFSSSKNEIPKSNKKETSKISFKNISLLDSEKTETKNEIIGEEKEVKPILSYDSSSKEVRISETEELNQETESFDADSNELVTNLKKLVESFSKIGESPLYKKLWTHKNFIDDLFFNAFTFEEFEKVFGSYIYLN